MGRLGLHDSVGGRLALISCVYRVNRVNSRIGYIRRDDSTDTVIIIIAIHTVV